MEKIVNFKSNFFTDLFEKRQIPDIYQKITYSENNHCFYESLDKQILNSKVYNLYTVTLIPDYLNPILKNNKKYIKKTYFQNNLGYAIHLKNIVTIDEYLKYQFKSKSKDIKRSLTRLEACFNIRYQIIFGEITKEEYQFLMSNLKNMLLRRFAQRQDDNKNLRDWDLILDKTFDQITKKEASLFIIYDNDEPIDISLNYHCKNIFFSAISSYDIDYHKFGVGHVEIIKLVEWCIRDQYEYLELGYGDLVFKRRWCNHIYNFRYQVVYNQESLIISLLAKMELFKLSLKEFLKARKVNLIYENVKTKLSFKRINQKNEESELAFEKISIADPDIFATLTKVDPETEGFIYLRRILYEFLYSSIEHKDNTSIFKISDNPNSFLIKGKNNAQQITFKT